MKIRYNYRNSGPYTHKEVFCTLTLPASQMVSLLLDANIGLASLSAPGADVTEKEAAGYAAHRQHVLDLVHEIEDREKKAKQMMRDDLD
jgi:hypothetical protein